MSRIVSKGIDFLFSPLGVIIGGKVGKLMVSASMIAAGIATGQPGLIAMGVGKAVSAFAGKPKTPKASENRLHASIDLRATRVAVFGTTAAATDIRDEEYTGTDQEYFHRFMVCAAHKLSGFREIHFDNKLAWSAAGGVQGEFVGYLTVAAITEGSAANAINISARMGSARRYTGCAYVHFRFKLTGNSKKAESPFAQNVPSRVTIVADGMPVYDARFDSTVAGGSGTMRADNQATWAFTYGGVDVGNNPAAQLGTWMLGWKIQNPVTSEWKRSVGKGIPPDRIDWTSFITAANLCDEAVTLAAGGTEKRYRTAAAIGDDEDPYDVIGAFRHSMSALFDDADGQFRLLVMHNDLADPGILTFTQKDILGAFTWNPESPLSGDFNIVRGSYTDPSSTSLYQMAPYTEAKLTSVDGIERSDPVDFAMVQSSSQAQRLARQRLQRAQYPGVFSAEFQATAWRVMRGDVIKLTFPALGFVAKLFRVMEAEARVDGVVPLVLREENSAIYAWDNTDVAPVVPAAPTVYEWQNLPLLQAIDEVALSVLVQWSPDGSTSWGDFSDGDRWLRVSTDAGATWGTPVLAIGEDGFGSRHVFKRAASAPETPTGNDLPSGWSDGPPSGTDPLWLSVAVQEPDGTLITAWTIPVRLDAPSLRVQWSLDGSTLWHDTFSGADAYIRTSVDGGTTWSAAARAVGEDGLGKQHVFKRAVSAPATPSGNGIPSGWSDGPPAGTDPLWLSTANQDPFGTTLGVWSAPIRLDGAAGTPGVNAVVLDIQKPAISVAADYVGTPKSGQLPVANKATLRSGNSDVTASSTLAMTSTGTGGTIDGSGNISVTSATSTSGVMTVTATYGGVDYVRTFGVNLNPDPLPPTTPGSITDFGTDPVSGTTYAEGGESGIWQVQASAGGVLYFDISASASWGSSSGAKTLTIAIKAEHRVAGSGGAWTIIAAGELTGSGTATPGEPGDAFAGGSSLAQTGLTASGNYEVKVSVRRVSGSQAAADVEWGLVARNA